MTVRERTRRLLLNGAARIEPSKGAPNECSFRSNAVADALCERFSWHKRQPGRKDIVDRQRPPGRRAATTNQFAWSVAGKARQTCRAARAQRGQRGFSPFL